MFIGRRPDGTIYGAWTSKQPNDADHQNIEELPDNHPDVVEFLKPKPIPPNPLEELFIALKADPTLLTKIKAIK